jgi:competence protein ComEC
MESFLSKYKILPPLTGFIIGILLAEYLEFSPILIVILFLVFSVIYLVKPNLVFLIFIPIGILFSSGPNIQENNISNLTGKVLDLEGVLYRSPESREEGSRLFIDVNRIFTERKEQQATGKAIITTEERIQGLAYGDRIRVLNTKLRSPRTFQNPGNFDIRRYYERQRIYATGFVTGEGDIISFGKSGHANLFLHELDRLRVKFGNFVRSNSPFPEGEVLNAITIGDQGGIPSELRNKFSEGGISHLLSISGLHVAAIALIFYVIIKWILKRSEYLLLRFQIPRLTAALTIPAVITYMFIAGFTNPVVRASIMAIVYLVSIVIGRQENRLNTLGLSAFIILLWHPWALFELSFQLSFASVLGILVMHRFYPLKVNTLKDKLLSSVKTTVAATLATLPFIINSFGTISTVSIPSNLIAVPIVEFLIVPLGLISFLTYLISELVARVFISIDAFLIKLLLSGTEELLKLPFSYLTIPAPNYKTLSLLGLTLIPLLAWKRYPRLRVFLPVFIIGFFVIWALGSSRNPNSGFLEVNFLDAGNKNITFIRLPEEKTILIDGGFSRINTVGYIERSVLTPFLLKSGVININYMVLTSLDKDHLEGTKSILTKFKVENIWTNGRKLDGGLWELIKNKKIGWKNILDYGTENIEIEGVKVELLKPGGEFRIKDSSLPNPILVRLTFKDVSFLVGEGINDESAIKSISESNRDKIQSEVLNFPKFFTDQKGIPEFIGVASPKIIVTNSSLKNISKIGKDRKPYVYSNSTVFQTDTEGLVSVITDGKEIKVRTFLDKNNELLY